MYKTLGFKESQMVLGIPGYGRAFTLESPELKARVVGEHSSMLYQEKSLKVPVRSPLSTRLALKMHLCLTFLSQTENRAEEKRMISQEWTCVGIRPQPVEYGGSKSF